MCDGVIIETMARKSFPKTTISQELQDLTDDRFRDLRRPRIVMFYKNGDRYFKGKTLHITPHRYLHYEELLSDLSKSMSLPYGVRRIYTPIGGTLIEDIEELKDGESYVCASFEKFQRIKYGHYSTQNHLREFLRFLLDIYISLKENYINTLCIITLK
ncbi:unnamed protein product [Clavelina lepadiformis]|uniref:Doublecortin domain-containing protein n=1 Tax=Clavelina lepadiformis TaxID=159417 RepID=A0ABP0FGW8_CLALP